jgi:CheY-like chemotaxis protein
MVPEGLTMVEDPPLVDAGRADVLVVDDDAGVRRMLADAIWDLVGVRAARAASGREARARVREKVPDVVLVDMALPDLDGWALAAELRADPETRWVRVVGMSGIGPAGAALAAEAGCAAYLPKPFDLDELSAVLRRCIGDDAAPG